MAYLLPSDKLILAKDWPDLLGTFGTCPNADDYMESVAQSVHEWKDKMGFKYARPFKIQSWIWKRIANQQWDIYIGGVLQPKTLTTNQAN